MIDIESLKANRPIVIIGAAFGDVLVNIQSLPQSGDDVTAQSHSQQIGGCAFNVARALSCLKFDFFNAIPVGNGNWGKAVELAMQSENIPIMLRNTKHDNGWCIAMVESNKERTFITINGCEQYWSEALLAQIPLPKHAIIYSKTDLF